MELAPHFSFQPLPALETPVQQPFPEVASPLGPLAGLVGKSSGQGSNVIWRPNHTAGQDRFLELKRDQRAARIRPDQRADPQPSSSYRPR